MTLGLFIRDAGNVPREISELVIRDGTNTPRTISELWARDTNNVPRLVFNPSGSASLAVGVFPEEAYGFSFGTGTATTDPVTATATNGTAPYTYAWTLISHTSLFASPVADSPSSASTTFTQTSIGLGSIVTGTFRVTATDANMNTAFLDIIAYFSDNPI